MMAVPVWLLREAWLLAMVAGVIAYVDLLVVSGAVTRDDLALWRSVLIGHSSPAPPR